MLASLGIKSNLKVINLPSSQIRDFQDEQIQDVFDFKKLNCENTLNFLPFIGKGVIREFETYKREISDIKVISINRLHPDFKERDFEVLNFKVIDRQEYYAPQIDIIIPCFKRSDFIIDTIEKLNIPSNAHFIIVFDGHDEKSNELIKTFIKKEISFTAVLSPRINERSFGEGHYRAGPMRNLGASFSKTSSLLFCDSDIILTQNLIEEHLSNLSDCDIFYSLKTRNNDSVSSKDFWSSIENQKFLDNSKLDFIYFSSCLFSCSKEYFLNIGQFNPIFTSWGGEDNEFAYRVLRQGGKIKIGTSKCLEVYSSEKKEYRSDAEKSLLLTRGIESFYNLYYDTDIFKAYEYLID
ncbi:MAG: hypothetical protein Fur0010_00860 [Bdellovibrio sp.]